MRQNKERVCAVEGCKNQVKARGYCDKHYNQLRRNGELERKICRHNEISICVIDGCEERAVAMGFCKSHYKRWYDTGSPHESDLQRPLKTKKMIGLSLKERLEKFSKKDEETGCIEWIGSHDVDGYGQTEYKGKNYRTHRLAYKIYIGSIPKGKIVCHHCDNPSCINTDHLYVGTYKDNAHDRMKRGRSNIKTGEESSASKLTRARAIELIQRRKNGERSETLAEDYGITIWTVNDIMKGKSWKNIDRDSIVGASKKDSAGRIKNTKTKLSEHDVGIIKYKLNNKSASLRELSKEFGVDRKLIMNIRDNKIWKHICASNEITRKRKRKR